MIKSDADSFPSPIHCANVFIAAFSSERVGAAIGFPLGQNTVECKAFETRDAIAKGATEIDTVINVRALQKGQTEIVKKEIEDMVSICKPAGVICKVILETCYLTDEEKETVCRIAKEAGVDFVKTSTGFGTAGATVHDVALMRRVVGPAIGVKAAGGIRDLDSALALIQAGATMICLSSGVTMTDHGLAAPFCGVSRITEVSHFFAFKSMIDNVLVAIHPLSN